MGEQGSATRDSRFLVVMNNKDVYYATGDDATDILACVEFGTSKVYRFQDVKTGNWVAVNSQYVSSVVEPSRGSSYGVSQ